MAKQVIAGGNPEHNIIASDTSLEGTLVTNSDIRISGKLSGTIKGMARVLVLQTATMEGDLHADECTVAGRVKGQLIVAGCLTLTGTANVDGNITTGRLIVEEGATFNGDCVMENTRQSMGPQVEIGTPRPAAPVQAPPDPSKKARRRR